jgi:hypothetical protein
MKDGKIIEQQLQDTSEITHSDVARNYFELLGGKRDNFSIDTANRIRSFATELEQKRNYKKFTTFASDCDDEMIIEMMMYIYTYKRLIMRIAE